MGGTPKVTIWMQRFYFRKINSTTYWVSLSKSWRDYNYSARFIYFTFNHFYQKTDISNKANKRSWSNYEFSFVEYD